MTPPIEIAVWIVMMLSFAYLTVIAIFTYGWYSLKLGFIPKTAPSTKVSVVVAVRNEETNIDSLLASLLQQEYPKELIEVIIVDDHSEDATYSKVKDFLKKHPELHIKLISSPGTGKKDAIGFGIDSSQSGFILTTDGDCIPARRWIRKMTAYYEIYRPKILLGPVVYAHEKTFFQKLFSLDFMSMVASGAGSAGVGLPFMGNAANMAFDRSVFSNKTLKTVYSSGDDVFLIHGVKKSYGGRSMHFIKDAHAVVTTHAPKGWNAFFNQRLRWASKAKGYRDGWSIIVSWVVLLLNVSLMVLFVAGLWWHWLLAIWFLFITLKALIDFPLLNGYAQLTGKGKLMVFLWPVEFLYPVYISIVGIGSVFLKYRWKGRDGLK